MGRKYLKQLLAILLVLGLLCGIVLPAFASEPDRLSEEGLSSSESIEAADDTDLDEGADSDAVSQLVYEDEETDPLEPDGDPDEDIMALNAVTDGLSAFVKGVGIYDGINIHVKGLSDYGVSNPESELVTANIPVESQNTGCRIDLGSLSFSDEGIYEYRITLAPMNNIRQNTQSYLYHIETAFNGSGILEVKESYYVDEATGEQVEQPEFLVVTNESAVKNSQYLSQARRALSEMSLDEKVGQVFMSHYTTSDRLSLDTLINKYHPGSLILFKYDVEGNTPLSLKQKLSELQSKSSQGLMVAVDEEGGKVTRVSSVPGFRTAGIFPGPQELKVTGDHEASLQKIGADTLEKAKLLTDLGFNMNLAPVADVAGPSGYIYERTYGGDGLENATYVEAVVSTAKENGLGTCLKHFPGYGGTSSNTHEGFAVNDLSRESFDNNDLLPFASGIAAGSDMVLITHNIVNCLDTENPASLSPACYSLLKEDMNFNGIAITDDLAMRAITDFVGSDSPSVRALQAGADMVITPNISVEWPKVKVAVTNGTLSTERLDDAVLTILYWKAEHGLLKESSVEAGFYDASGAKQAEGTFDAMWERAVAAGSGTVRIYKNLERNTSVSTGTAKITLDLYGFTISNTGGAGSDLFWSNTGGRLVVTDSFGSFAANTSSFSGRFHYYTYENGSLGFGIKDTTTYHSVDFRNSSVGRIKCSGSNRAFVMNGGDLIIQNGIISNGCDGVVTYSTKNGATGGWFRMTGGAFLDNTSSWNGGVFNFPAGTADTKIILLGGYLINNTARNNGGAVFTNGALLIDGDVMILGNTANYGGAIFAPVPEICGHAVIAHNKANVKDGALTNGTVLNIHENATIVSNTAATGGACAVTQPETYISGSVRIFDNTATTGNDLYLSDNVFLYLERNGEPTGLTKDARIGISHVSIPSLASVQIVQPYGSGQSPNPASKWPNSTLDCLVCDDSDFLATYHYRNTIADSGEKVVEGIWFTRSTQDELSWGVYLDGIFQESTLPIRYSDSNSRIVFTRIVKSLQKYGFDTESLEQYDTTWFGFMDVSGNIHVYDGSLSYDGDYKLLLNTEDKLTGYTMIFLGKQASPGVYTKEDICSDYSFRSINVHDVYAAIWNGGNGDTQFRYVPDGAKLSLELSAYTEDWSWSDRKQDNSDYDITFTDTGSKVVANIKNIHSSVIISNGRDDDVMYNVQYYAYVNQVDLSDVDGTNKMPVIDTTGGNLPENSVNQVIRYLTVNSSDSNRVARTNRLTQMYEDHQFVYSLNPKLAQIDGMRDDDGYELSAIWVLKKGLSPISINEDDFDVYRLSDFPSLKSLHDLHLTTRPEKVSSDTILIESNTTVRFVYKPVESTQIKTVNFYDYDVSDGQFYANDSAVTNGNSLLPTQLDPQPTSTQDFFKTVYAFTCRQGINQDANYHSTGSKLAFGNANTNSGLSDETWNNIKLNQYNRNPSVYRGCAFGLVDGIRGNDITGYYPSYAPGISAPYLFNQGSALGKTVYRNVPLSYAKVGDSYTLTGVGDTNTQNLDQFNHPKTGNTTYTNIWTNNFWPMDDFPSFGTDGHDIKWGNYTKSASRRFFQGDGTPTSPYNVYTFNFANSDDGLDHNAYFGMNFSINFTVPAGYTGPLDYCFFGDDDMWVFLDDQLVIDIGGVHSSVGEYANLWDYLDESSTEDTTHKLTIFYTERGASGSTCWMTFNLPQVQFASEVRDEDEGSLELTKEATGMADADTFYEFDVELFDANGNVPKDDFTYKRLDPDGNIYGYGLIENGKGSFSIRSGGKLIIPYLGDGIRYKITERQYDCTTTFSSRLGTDETTSKGVTTEGVIRKNETIYVKCENAFASGSVMPDTGSDGLLNLLSVSLWAIVPGILFLAVSYGYRQRRRKRFQ